MLLKGKIMVHTPGFQKMVHKAEFYTEATASNSTGNKIKDKVESLISEEMEDTRVSGKNIDITSSQSSREASESIVPQLQKLMEEVAKEGNTIVLSCDGFTCKDPNNVQQFIKDITGKETPLEEDLVGKSIISSISQGKETVEYKIETQIDTSTDLVFQDVLDKNEYEDIF